MKNVLAICASPSGLRGPLSLVEGQAKIYIFTKPSEIANIRKLEDMSVYDMIVMGPIDWRIPATSSGLASLFRSRFTGPIVAVGSLIEWRTLMENAGCDHVFKQEDEAAAFIRDTLFPNTGPC